MTSSAPARRSWERIAADGLGSLVLVTGALLSGCTTPAPPAVSDRVALLAPDTSTGFWTQPFPLDSRRTESGTIALGDFPNPGEAPLVDEYLRYGVEEIRGFGLASPLWLPFDGPISLPSWEGDPAQAARCEGPVRVVDVDPASPEWGRCRPLRWHQLGPGDIDPFLAPNLLVVQPRWGFPLRSDTTYALVLVDVADSEGALLRASAPLREALAGEGPHAAAFAPLTAFWDGLPEAVGTAFRLEDGSPDRSFVAAATVFRTQDAVGELRSLIEHAATDDSGPSWSGEVLPVGPDHPEFQNEYRLVETAYEAWNYQRGEVPYADEGGGFQWTEDGAPIPQRRERIPVAISLPLDEGEQPATGWPVVLHQHGTGGDRWSHLTGGPLRPGLVLGRRGFLSVGIPQPIHDDRWPERTPLGIELNSFNYFNPESGRSMFRQGAVDLQSLVRFVKDEMGAGGALATAHPDLRIDPARIAFLGHSQGGLTGALALPFVRDIGAWVLSGAGGGTSMTVIQREDPFVIRDTLLTAIGDPPGTNLTDDHPLIGLIQLMAETTDPLVYAPHWAEAEGDPSILLTEGIHDAQTPADTSEALAIAGGLPLLDPYIERGVAGLDLAGLAEVEAPVSGNAAGGEATRGLAQFDEDHFAIFFNADASILWSNFLWSFAEEGGPGTLGWEP